MRMIGKLLLALGLLLMLAPASAQSRIQRGKPPIVIAAATAKPIRQPSSADARLMRMEIQ